MEFQQLIDNFIEENKIDKKIFIKDFTPLQIYLQIEEITDKFLKEASFLIEENKIEESFEDFIEEKESDDEEIDLSTIPASEAFELLDGKVECSETSGSDEEDDFNDIDNITSQSDEDD